MKKNKLAKSNPDLELTRNHNHPYPTGDDTAIGTFKNLVRSKGKDADAIISKVANAATTACFAEQLDSRSGAETRYVVNISKEMKEAIDKGIIKLDHSKDGKIYAQLRDTNNRYGEKLSISEELIGEGIDPLAAMNALQLKAIQEQLAEMAETIDSISKDVKDVLQGQQNDRLALYYAGESLFLEAQNIQDPTFKALLTSQALKSLSDASAQLSIQLKSDLQYLREERYKEKRKAQAEEIDSRMESINKSFDVIHRAAFLKAYVYYDSNEIPAMLASVNEYARFLENTIVPNARKLAEFDRKDNLLRGGIWDKRTRSLSQVNEIKKQLSSGSTFYLEEKKKKGKANER